MCKSLIQLTLRIAVLPSIAYKETQICVKDNSIISNKICCFSASTERKRNW